MSLAILFHFLYAQHVSDINMSIIRSLQLFCLITTLVILFCKDGGFSISINYVVYWCVLVVTCLVALLKLVSVFLLILPVVVFSALWLLCSHVCSMFYWMIGNALLIYYVTVNLRLHIPWFDVCWRLGVVVLEWYPCCRLKNNWSVQVECGAGS